MYLLAVGLVLLALKFFEVGSFAELAWWWVILPFALTALWWSWADWSGYTKRKQVQAENERVASRIKRHRNKLGASGKAAKR